LLRLEEKLAWLSFLRFQTGLWRDGKLFSVLPVVWLWATSVYVCMYCVDQIRNQESEVIWENAYIKQQQTELGKED
jgi:hypothetical protein